MKSYKFILLAAIITASLAGSVLAQATGGIAGSVVDSLNAVVVGATITVVAPNGTKKTAITNARGEYSVNGLAVGKYTVKAIAPKFGLYENTEVEVAAGAKTDLTVVLVVTGVVENVEVSNDNKVNNDADGNQSATIIKGKDLDALPDDPDELETALQALAGPAAGPNGGQIYIDGFTGGNMPPKESIREIRINQNPFSAEFDRLGFGRIEILTKPGSDKWRGSLSSNFNDESMNSRNPFASNRAPSQLRSFSGNVSGPIVKKKSSFFFDMSNRDNDSNVIVNAIILDPSLNLQPFRKDFRVPTSRFSVGPRVDYAINDKNTLVARYSYEQGSSSNQGIGDTSLPSRASKSNNFSHEFRVTETAILNAKTVNETRFSWEFNKRQQLGDNSIPTVSVSSYFANGGSSVGTNFNSNHTWELQNFTSTTFGKNAQHSFKVGGRLRGVSITDQAQNNYAGTYSFSGAQEVRSPLNCDPVGPGCVVVSPAITSIDQYRGKLLGTVGTQYNPTSFSITTGNPDAKVSQIDGGIFATDDWRVSPALLLSFGLRYENQSNIKSNMNFAPRFGYAWSPGAGGAKAPKTVFRGGAGIFYDRFGENYTLTADRYNGLNQLSLTVNSLDRDPVRQAAAIALLSQPVFTLNGVTNSLTASQILAAIPQSNAIRSIQGNITAPYTMQAAFGVERQLPAKTTLTVYYIVSRSEHLIRQRNVNAPVCSTPTTCGARPQSTLGDIFEYESAGKANQNQVMVNFRTTVNSKISFSGNYGLSFQKSDADGGGPAYAYNLAGEYGRSSGDIRHRFVLFGNFTAPWNISFAPFILALSGRPFNIVTGTDLNGDGLLTERPTYGQVASRCTQLNLTAKFCNIGGHDPNATIPRNYGEGPSSFSVNMRVSKTFGFGKSPDTGGGGRSGGGRNGGGGGAVGGMGGMGGMGGGRGGERGGGGGGMFGGGETRKPYNLNLGLSFNNLFNNVNLNNPVGTLLSSRFGQSTNIAGGFGGFGGGGGGTANRRIEASARFSW